MMREVRPTRGLGPGVHPPPGARTPALVDVDAGADGRMRALRALVVGAGGIGGRIAQLLAAAGVRELTIVDSAEVKPESLLTHDVEARDVGRPKAAVVGRRAGDLAPHTRVRYACRPFQDLPLAALADVDVVLLASDNLAAELAVGEACRRHGLPLIQAALYGQTLTAEVRSLSNQDDAGPCLACAWAEADWERLDRGTRFACVGGDGLGGGHLASSVRDATRAPAPLRSAAPTRTTSELCAMAAALAVSELRRRTLSAGSDGLAAPDRSLEWSGHRMATVESPLRRAPRCAADHARWRWAPHVDLGAATPLELLRAVGAAVSDLASASLRLEGHTFALLARCACGRLSREHTFLAREAPRCDACGTGLIAAGAAWREAPLDALDPALTRSLRASGALAPSTAVLCSAAAPPTAFFEDLNPERLR